MEPSDFLTILGLALAVWALIPSKERRFVLLFFSTFELVMFGVALLAMHYLMAFDWLLKNWAPGLTVFLTEKGLPSTTWAYIVALVTIAYPVIKVSAGFFAGSRRTDLIHLYEAYLKEGELDLLAGFVAKYHIDDIEQYLRGMSKVPPKSGKDIVLRRRTASDLAREQVVSTKRMKFAASVYSYILQHEAFVRGAANKYPELFAQAFNGMRSRAAADQDFAKLYVGELFRHLNPALVQELKIVEGANSSLADLKEQYDIPILAGVLSHTDAAQANYVWYPVGEQTVKSLKHDSAQREFLQRAYDSDLDHELWSQKAYVAIVYFNYMVRETIYHDSGYHMWLFYFRHFGDLLLDLIPEPNTYDARAATPSFAHKLLDELFSVMTGWLDLARAQETDRRIIDTVKCLGWCIHSLCQASEAKVPAYFRGQLLDRVLRTYFEFTDYPDNPATRTALEWFEKMFLFPKGVDFGIREVTTEYLTALQEAWNEFDKVPYQYDRESDVLERFETNVLDPLGLKA